MAASHNDIREMEESHMGRKFCLICCVIFAIILFVFGVTVISALAIENQEEGFVPVEGDLAPITIITADRDNV